MEHITRTERKILSEMLSLGESYRAINKAILKFISSISEEINKNGGREKYDPHTAHSRARTQQLERRERSKLEISEGLRKYVIGNLAEDWSPEQIAGKLRKQAKGKSVISHETIYPYIYSQEGKQLKLWKHLQMVMREMTSALFQMLITPSRVIQKGRQIRMQRRMKRRIIRMYILW